MRSPSMYSSTRYGCPSSDTPASSRRAMFGCWSFARMLASRLKRSAPLWPISARFNSLIAATPSNRSSLAPRPPDAAHSALADRRFERVRAERAPRERRVGHRPRRRTLEEAFRRRGGIRVEQHAKVRSERRIGRAHPLEPAGAFGDRQLERVVEVGTQLPPAGAIDRGHATLVAAYIVNGGRNTTSIERGRIAHRAVQQHARFFPVALNRALGDVAERRDLAERESAEELEIDQLREIRIDLCEIVERFADRLDVRRRHRGFADLRVERRDLEATAALLRVAITRIVDDETAHRARGVREKPRLVGKCDAFARRDVEVGFMQQRRRTQMGRAAAPPQLAAGDAVQLVVERGEQRAARGRAPLFGGLNQRFETLINHRQYPAHVE